MQLGSRTLTIQDETLRSLVRELGDECGRVLALIHQLQIPGLQDNQKADILAELTASAVYLHTHCDDAFQDLLGDELERLPDEGN